MFNLDSLALLLVAETKPEVVGSKFAGLAICFLFLAGALKCVMMIRRPATNTLCVLSLSFSLLAWAASGFSNLIKPASGSHHPVVAMLLLFLLTGLVVASFVLAIVGLVQYARGKGRWGQGKAQAIWGLVLSGVIFGLIMIGVASAISERVGETGSITDYYDNEPKSFESEVFNFRVTTPGSRWVSLPPKVLNDDAVVSFRRTLPEVGWIVIAEQSGVNSGISDMDMVEIVKANMLSGSPRSSFSEPILTAVDGMEGYQITAESRIDGATYFYDYWVAEHHGYAYQLITFGLLEERKAVNKEARAFRRAFKLINHDSMAVLAEGDPDDGFREPAYGFAVDFPDDTWLKWDGWVDELPESVAASLYGNVGAIAVTTIPLEGVDPSDRDLIAVMLETFGFEYPGGEVRDAGRIEADGASGFAIDANRSIDGIDYLYRIHILRNEYRAYMVSSWVMDMSADRLTQIQDVMEAIRFTKPVPAPAGDPRVVQAESDLLNRIGLRAFQDDRFELALDAFRAAAARDPSKYIYVDNAVNTLGRLGRNEQAIEYVEEHLPRFSGEVALKANYAYRLAQVVERYDDAVNIYQEVFDSDYEDETYITDFILTLRELERQEEALAALDRYEDRHPGRSYPAYRAHFLSDLGRHEEAVEMLQEATKRGPFNAVLTAELAQIHLNAGQGRQAVEVAEELIRAGSGTANVYYIKGDAEVGLQWYQRAKVSLAKAYELDGQASTKEYFDYVAGILGEGDNTLVRTELVAVPVPEAIRDTNRVIESEAWQAPADADAFDLSYSTGYYYEAGKPFRETQRRVIRIVDQAGVERFSTLTFDFDGQAESLYVNHLEVRDPDGRVLARGDLESYYVVDTNQDEMGTDDKTLTIPVPGLVPGCELHYVVTTESQADTDEFPFRMFYELAAIPRRYRLVYVSGDVADVKFVASGGPRQVSGEGLIGWYMQDPSVYVWESGQPDLNDWHDTLALGPATTDWPGLAREYLDRISDRLDTPDQVIEIAASSVDSGSSDEYKAKALAAYVRDTLSYTAIEFGTRGTMPSPTDLVLTNRYGDCKDHALLLWQLLKSSGVQANLALVDTGADIVVGLPSLDQFDHMVVYLPDVAGGQMIDCTSKNGPVVGGVPPGLVGQSVLILDPDNPRFEQTPRINTVPSEVRSDSEMIITPEGDVRVKQSLTLTGWQAIYIRSYLRSDSPDEQLRNVQGFLQSYESLRLTSFETENLDDPSEPMVLNMTYTIDGVFDTVDDLLIGRLPALWERYYLEPSAMASRVTPFALTDTLAVKSRIRVTPPAGMRFGSIRSDEPESSSFFRYKSSTRDDQGRLVIMAVIERLSGQHEPQAYDAYVTAASRSLKTIRGPITLTKP